MFHSMVSYALEQFTTPKIDIRPYLHIYIRIDLSIFVNPHCDKEIIVIIDAITGYCLCSTMYNIIIIIIELESQKRVESKFFIAA